MSVIYLRKCTCGKTFADGGYRGLCIDHEYYYTCSDECQAQLLAMSFASYYGATNDKKKSQKARLEAGVALQ